MLRDLVLRNRSYRRFDQGYALERATLESLVDLARLSASASNMQPLRYLVYADAETNGRIFASLAWAGYLKDWPGPVEGERPMGYIVMLGDTTVKADFGCDHGIAAQSILLGAVESGLGGCMLGAINRKQLRETLAISERYEILLVIALGKPVEQVVLDEVELSAENKYWRDAQQVHHVPKRKLRDIILN
jgi:nitroreductase